MDEAAAGCCTCANVIRYGASASYSGAWLDIEREHGGAHRRLVRPGQPVAFYLKPKRRRQFTHPKRWRYAKEPGELMQADHMSIRGRRRERVATCPVSKWSGLQVIVGPPAAMPNGFWPTFRTGAVPIRSLQGC